MEDSQVYEVDIDIDTAKWQEDPKDAVVEEDYDQVKELKQPFQSRQISIATASDYSQVNESFKSEDKA